MLWFILAAGILMLVFSVISAWKQFSYGSMTLGGMILGVMLPGLLGSIMVTTFWVMLIAQAIKR
jgi:hypothetical protein